MVDRTNNLQTIVLTIWCVWREENYIVDIVQRDDRNWVQWVVSPALKTRRPGTRSAGERTWKGKWKTT